MSDFKSRSIIVDSVKNDNEVRVTNGRVHVIFVNRTLPSQEGYGESSIKGGIAVKGEAVVASGALRISS